MLKIDTNMLLESVNQLEQQRKQLESIAECMLDAERGINSASTEFDKHTTAIKKQAGSLSDLTDQLSRLTQILCDAITLYEACETKTIEYAKSNAYSISNLASFLPRHGTGMLHVDLNLTKLVKVELLDQAFTLVISPLMSPL